MTIPRLELMAILIGNTSSTIRHDTTGPHQYKEENPVDVATRGLNPKQLKGFMPCKWLRLLRTTAWILKFIRLTTKSGLSWLQQAQSEGVNDDEINKWNLFYTEDDKLWRSTSRLENSELPETSKYPMYLPRHNPIRNSLYYNNMKIYACRSFKSPPMVSLPETHVNRSRAFAHVGVDYFGPLSFKGNSVPTKRWALRTITTQVTVFNFLAKDGMKWKNIVSKAPWQGGIYERLIGLTKNPLKRAIGRKYLAERELVTLIAEVEGIFNARPLTYVNFDDCRTHTKGNYLTQRSTKRTPRKGEIALLNESGIPRGMWKLLRIKGVKIDKDGQVMNVQVETPTGKLLDRPINVLYPLEVNNDEDHLELNSKESTKVLEIEQDTGKLQEPIAM
uniref:DUF5641 domain-containing protein n=1 Tax=Loa loa TaxID=7209 RepID=A0A1I7VXD3_LOALO